MSLAGVRHSGSRCTDTSLHVAAVHGEVVCIRISCCMLQLSSITEKMSFCRSMSQRIKMHRHLTACCSNPWRSRVHKHLLLHVTFVFYHWKEVLLQEFITAGPDAQNVVTVTFLACCGDAWRHHVRAARCVLFVTSWTNTTPNTSLSASIQMEPVGRCWRVNCE